LGNPFNWIANKLNPTIKDEQPTKTDEQTKKKLAEKGQLGLFETVPGSIAPSKGDSLVSKPKFTEVRALHFRFVQLTSLIWVVSVA